MVGNATTEVLLLSVSAGAGLSAVFVLMLFGVLPDMTQAAWSGILAGPLLIGSAGLTYLGIERLLARGGNPSRALEPIGSRADKPRERSSVWMGLLIALTGVVVAMIGSMVLGLAQEFLFEVEVEEQRVILDLVARGDRFELALLGVSAVLLAPVTEELLFRHMFFRRLLQASGPVLALTLSALAFALAHWNPIGLLIYAWLGTVFALAYWYSGRLWVAMLVHAGHNAFALYMLLNMPDALP